VIGVPSIQSPNEPARHLASSCPSGSQGASYLFDVEPWRRLRYDAGLARRPTSGLPIAPTRRTRRPPTRGRRNPPARTLRRNSPTTKRTRTIPAKAAHSPANAAVMATLPSMGTASPVNATETKLKTTSSSSRSSPVISRPTFPPIQPDGARPVRRQDRDCRWSEIVSSARPSESTATARVDGSRTVPEVHKRSCKPNDHRCDRERRRGRVRRHRTRDGAPTTSNRHVRPDVSTNRQVDPHNLQSAETGKHT
jgi:hypothetical protein